MDRTRKIILLVIMFMGIISFSSVASAWTPTLQSPLFPQGNVYCKQKGGPVRFTHDDAPDMVVSRETTTTNRYPTQGERNRLLDSVKAKVIEQLPDYVKGIPVGGTFTDYDDAWGSDLQLWNTPEYEMGAVIQIENNTVAYTFSNLISALTGDSRIGNYQKPVSETASNYEVQQALWADPKYNIGHVLGATALYSEAVAYEQYHNKYIVPGYENQVRFEDTNPKVIALRDEQAYILGPYVLTYPDDGRFSFINDIYFVDENGNQITARPQVIKANTSRPYPSSGETFYLKIKAADINWGKYLDLRVSFRYLYSTSATYQVMEGTGRIDSYEPGFEENVVHYHEKVGDRQLEDGTWEEIIEEGYYVHVSAYLKRQNGTGTYNAQVLALKLSASRDWQTYEISWQPPTTPTPPPPPPPPPPQPVDLTFDIKGYVYEDSMGGKESLPDGLYTEGGDDKKIPNVIVTLYQIDQNNVETQYAVTKTDANGQYEFLKLNSMYKYYVKFTYNGMYYEPTTYKAGASGTDPYSASWEINSKATDRPSQREAFNQKFASIRPSPNNYAGGSTFSKKALQGYVLQSDGEYRLENTPVIDNWGNLINAGANREMARYVEDCYMDAYTGLNNNTDYYNIKDRAVVDNKNTTDVHLLNEVFEPVYDSNYYINLGLFQRPEADLALRKDVYSATIEINGKSHTYEYDQRAETDESTNSINDLQNSNTFWDIDIRLSDAYYDESYSREVYRSDNDYKVSMYGENYAEYGKVKGNGVNVPDDELNVYVTYKLTLRNQSLSVTMSVDEIVDYFDEDYDYVDNRSYIVTSRRGGNKQPVQASYQSRYSNETNIEGYDNLYITGLQGTYLTSGQTVYVYLTYRVKKDLKSDGENWVRLDEEITKEATPIGLGKENIAEINAYSTRYGAGTRVPNIGNVAGQIAGIVDKDSTPGNLDPASVPKDGDIRYEDFEDDTDKAPNLRLILHKEDEANRTISGVVWEDARTKQVNVATIADGIRQESEAKINGVTVQLVELLKVKQPNGQYEMKEYVWREFGADGLGPATVGQGTGSGTKQIETPIINTSNLVDSYNFGADAENYRGAYVFKSFVPGNYVVRFIYGDTTRTVLTNDVNADVNQIVNNVGLNAKSYNGQDYKSTTYQEGLTTNTSYEWREKSTFNTGTETKGAVIGTIQTYNKEQCTQNESGTYLYDIVPSELFDNSANLPISDAKDIFTNKLQANSNDIRQTINNLNARQEVMDYSNSTSANSYMINHIAEVLASHRDVQTYPNGTYSKETINNLLNELMLETKMTAETGLMNIEFEYASTETTNNSNNNRASYAIRNVDLGLEERPKQQLEIEKQIKNVKITLSDKTVLFDNTDKSTNLLWQKHRFYNLGYDNRNFLNPSLYGSIENIRNSNASKFGVVQISMDEELMHGATIEIIYTITVKNVGEADYNTNKFYYTGVISNSELESSIVRTTVNQVIDYVPNNLEFHESDNAGWRIISNGELLSQGLVNANLEKRLEEYNTIITTQDFGSIALVPEIYKKVNGGAVSTLIKDLTLTQLISPENEEDDLTYKNVVEIVKTSNIIGRRNEYSVVGNQDVFQNPQELDTDRAEQVTIIPPFGVKPINYALYIGIGIILLVGISFIVFKIINRKKY